MFRQLTSPLVVIIFTRRYHFERTQRIRLSHFSRSGRSRFQLKEFKFADNTQKKIETMSSEVNASQPDALRSTSQSINSEATPNSRRRSNMSSLVSPSPGASSASSRRNPSLLIGQPSPPNYRHPTAPRSSSLVLRRRRSSGGNNELQHNMSLASGGSAESERLLSSSPLSTRASLMDSVARAQSRSARKLNDSLVYLDGPQIYTCAQCRTHLTSHDDIISKSFHGRHGRAYLFDHCVNVKIGPPEDRLLMTGLHSVNDIFCKRCKNMVGWTYSRAYETSQKYKEGKFIVEKINLHLEESDYYDVAPPAGERKDRFRARSISWGSDNHRRGGGDAWEATIYEYRPSSSGHSTPPLSPRSSRRLWITWIRPSLYKNYRWRLRKPIEHDSSIFTMKRTSCMKKLERHSVQRHFLFVASPQRLLDQITNLKPTGRDAQGLRHETM